MSDEWKLEWKPLRMTSVAAGLMLVTLLVGAADTEPILDAKVQGFVDHLGARTIDCPAELVSPDVVDRTYCSTLDLNLKQLRKSVLKFIRKSKDVSAVQLGKWSERPEGTRATPFLLDSLVMQLVFDPPTATLLLVPYEGCLKDSDTTSPGLFEWETENVEPPEQLNFPTPKYPERAFAARINGAVVLQAIIKKDGTTDEHCVLYVQPSGYDFAESAIRALEQARYKPATQDGKPVDIVMTVASTFAVN